ncbi:hypothetical protein [Streptomyces sp. NPDC101776]|uniref:hypothetical protein n=1 Tax=Streptomyces sp. NPDC101776 TaxID=3366146 RepID=UPI0037FED384
MTRVSSFFRLVSSCGEGHFVPWLFSDVTRAGFETAFAGLRGREGCFGGCPY